LRQEGTSIPPEAPIYNALVKHLERDNIRLHMPGHIGKPVLLAPEIEVLAGLDFTEIPGLDDLHVPKGIIAEAQGLMSQACGASHSYFLINGATCGLHALLLSLPANSTIIVPRNAHRAFYGGLVLSGGIPVYMACEIEPELGIGLAVNPREAAEVIDKNPEAEVLWTTSPSYFGTVSDIRGLAALSRQKDKILLVDEAHGSHFYFHPRLPDSALSQGATAVVNGLHKTWPALTQTACLHTSEGYKYQGSLEQALDMLITTSPSYPLMASIDLARAFMQTSGYSFLDRALEMAAWFKSEASQIEGIKVYENELTQIEGVVAVDPLKVLIGVQGLSLSGGQVSRVLAEDYAIQVEMSGERYVLAIFSLLHEKKHWERFYLALKDMAIRYRAEPRNIEAVMLPPTTRMVMTPRTAHFSSKRAVPMVESRGKIAGEMVVPYPPGIPCLLPGEEINNEIWDYLKFVHDSGLYVQGPQSNDLTNIMIIDN